MNKKELYKKWESNYNVAARGWNGLPGVKLKYPEDRFVIEYCACKKRTSIEVKEIEGVEIRTCYDCHKILPGEFE